MLNNCYTVKYCSQSAWTSSKKISFSDTVFKYKGGIIKQHTLYQFPEIAVTLMQ